MTYGLLVNCTAICVPKYFVEMLEIKKLEQCGAYDKQELSQKRGPRFLFRAPSTARGTSDRIWHFGNRSFLMRMESRARECLLVGLLCKDVRILASATNGLSICVKAVLIIVQMRSHDCIFCLGSYIVICFRTATLGVCHLCRVSCMMEISLNFSKQGTASPSLSPVREPSGPQAFRVANTTCFEIVRFRG